MAVSVPRGLAEGGVRMSRSRPRCEVSERTATICRSEGSHESSERREGQVEVDADRVLLRVLPVEAGNRSQ